MAICGSFQVYKLDRLDYDRVLSKMAAEGRGKSTLDVISLKFWELMENVRPPVLLARRDIPISACESLSDWIIRNRAGRSSTSRRTCSFTCALQRL